MNSHDTYDISLIRSMYKQSSYFIFIEDHGIKKNKL